MNGAMLAGVGLTVLAGVMAGNCMLPMKFARRWKWENIWLVFSIVSLVVLPWGLALALVKHLFQVYQAVPASTMAAPLLFGAGWGVAQILFGVSVRRLGMGLGYAIIIGLGAVLGTLVPLFAGQRRFVPAGALAEICGGVAMMIAGIALTAWGGRMRDHVVLNERTQNSPQSGYAAALVVAILCGFMAPMLNYAFAFGQGLAMKAVLLGNSPIAAAYAVWPIALLGGFVPNVAYCLYLLGRNRSWSAFSPEGSEVIWPTLMAILWMDSMAVYGMSAVYLGELGTSIGWGLFQIFMIMTATLSGLLTAEWKNAPKRAHALLGAGMTGLVVATVLLAVGGR